MAQPKTHGAGLQPGDRNIRAVVRPDLDLDSRAPGTWSCTRCGIEFDKRSTYAVVYGRRDRTVPYAFMVCPDCADLLTPIRLSLNWQQLATYRAAAGAADEDAAQFIADHVADVLNRRGVQPPADVRLRAIDTHVLADNLASSRLQLIQKLVRMKVLSGLDMGTAPALASSHN